MRRKNIDEYTIKVIRQLYSDGKNIVQIAKEINYSKSAVANHLQTREGLND